MKGAYMDVLFSGFPDLLLVLGYPRFSWRRRRQARKLTFDGSLNRVVQRLDYRWKVSGVSLLASVP